MRSGQVCWCRRRDGRYVLHCTATGEQPWELHEFYVEGMAGPVDDPAARRIANATAPTANPSGDAGGPPLVEPFVVDVVRALRAQGGAAEPQGDRAAGRACRPSSWPQVGHVVTTTAGPVGPRRSQLCEERDDVLADPLDEPEGVAGEGHDVYLVDAGPAVPGHAVGEHLGSLGVGGERSGPQDRLADPGVVGAQLVAVGCQTSSLAATASGDECGPAKGLVASAYRATSRRVFFSPEPPIMIGGLGGLSGLGEQMVSASW